MFGTHTSEHLQVQALAQRAEQGLKVIIIHGAQDRTISYAASARLKDAIPSAELIEFDKCGHVPHEEYPDKFVATLVDRLKPSGKVQ